MASVKSLRFLRSASPHQTSVPIGTAGSAEIIGSLNPDSSVWTTGRDSWGVTAGSAVDAGSGHSSASRNRAAIRHTDPTPRLCA
jgi:hypothetical protein